MRYTENSNGDILIYTYGYIYYITKSCNYKKSHSLENYKALIYTQKYVST